MEIWTKATLLDDQGRKAYAVVFDKTVMGGD
jgi:hypothetical protein